MKLTRSVPIEHRRIIEEAIHTFKPHTRPTPVTEGVVQLAMEMAAQNTGSVEEARDCFFHIVDRLVACFRNAGFEDWQMANHGGSVLSGERYEEAYNKMEDFFPGA